MDECSEHRDFPVKRILHTRQLRQAAATCSWCPAYTGASVVALPTEEPMFRGDISLRAGGNEITLPGGTCSD